MFLPGKRIGIKHSLYILAMKSDSALSCLLSNPITIPDKFRAELHLWSGSEGVYRNSHPVISVCNKNQEILLTTQEVLERTTHR